MCPTPGWPTRSGCVTSSRGLSRPWSSSRSGSLPFVALPRGRARVVWGGSCRSERAVPRSMCRPAPVSALQTLPVWMRRSRNWRKWSTSCATPGRMDGSGRTFPRACCSWGHPGPARHCSPGRWREKPASPFFQFRAASSSRCSSAWGPHVCVTCSSRRARVRQPSSSSTSWMHWAGRAVRSATLAGTTRRSRR